MKNHNISMMINQKNFGARLSLKNQTYFKKKILIIVRIRLKSGMNIKSKKKIKLQDVLIYKLK